MKSRLEQRIRKRLSLILFAFFQDDQSSQASKVRSALVFKDMGICNKTNAAIFANAEGRVYP